MTKVKYNQFDSKYSKKYKELYQQVMTQFGVTNGNKKKPNTNTKN